MTAELNMILRLKLSSPSEESERLKSRVKLVHVKFFFFFNLDPPSVFDIIRFSNRILADARTRASTRFSLRLIWLAPR